MQTRARDQQRTSSDRERQAGPAAPQRGGLGQGVADGTGPIHDGPADGTGDQFGRGH